MEQYATAETGKNGNLRSKHYDELPKREFWKGEQPEPITHSIKQFPFMKACQSMGKSKIRMSDERVVAICCNNESLVSLKNERK